MQQHPELGVECYAGYRGEETPRTLIFGARRLEVLEIIDRWLSPEHRYFKVRADDDGIYIVRQDSASGDWQLTLYDSGRGGQGRLSST